MKPSFPFYKQPDSKDCGPTCLRIVAKHYGKLISLQEIRDISETTREGSSLFKLSLEMLRLTSDEVLGRSQMKKITGGYGGFTCKWVCSCGSGLFTLYDCTTNPTEICRVVYGSNGHCVPQS